MLGYELDDLKDMIDSINFVIEQIKNPDVRPGTVENLILAKDFLGGLWAEGYFDQIAPSKAGAQKRTYRTYNYLMITKCDIFHMITTGQKFDLGLYDMIKSPYDNNLRS